MLHGATRQYISRIKRDSHAMCRHAAIEGWFAVTQPGATAICFSYARA